MIAAPSDAVCCSPPPRRWRLISLSALAKIASAGASTTIAFALASSHVTTAVAADPAKSVRCRLVNVNIPADSPLRISTEINHPPILYILVKRNGVQLTQYSSQHKGWSVDFPKDSPDNEWEIPEGPDDRYSIELWDSNWGNDDLALSITGLKDQDFRGTIYEQGPKGMSKDRLVTITFAPVKNISSK